MITVTVDRGEKRAIRCDITDPNLAHTLASKRVTASFARVSTGQLVLKKQGNLPGSNLPDVDVTSQTADGITVYFFLFPPDYAALTEDSYMLSVWIDSGTNDDECVTPGGYDRLVINRAAPRV
jgi:hypothetical protein